ncbi:hypothetical protein KFE25_010053 [Diacronema lutheri]|uniref:CS domain-containing protein n=1 Tax=Diacronema lutheri TaxID=2081491 RepID=A0A7R9YPL7_DIALT|nr:hypothetical protein KFE25_010053 [Diacronema lutheri]|mmetsp:Transcript_8960/g.28163  ORF Transcript_8960/g.28163 Transcript_8960/m.28163 type:complete len:151 (+) Transcript_8960:71-523(+)
MAEATGALDESVEAHGRSSYYYWHSEKPAQRIIPAAIASAPASAEPVCVTLDSYAWLDDGATVKVFVPLAGAKSLPEGAIRCTFERDMVELRVHARDGVVRQLRLPNLFSSIVGDKSKWRASDERITLVLAKRDASEMGGRWYDLCRKPH